MALVVFSTDEINPSINLTKVTPMNGNETNLSNSYLLGLFLKLFVRVQV